MLSWTALVCCVLTGCESGNDIFPESATGFVLSLENISASVTASTRSTPAEIGKPDASAFKLTVRDQQSSATVYDGKFTTEVIKAGPGTYDITATYGEDVLIGLDAPFYKGTAVGTISEGATKPVTVSIACKVANALISVRFGRDEAETARFDKFYADPSLVVAVGGHAAELGKGQTQSVYLAADKQFGLTFKGRLKEDGNRLVSTPLESEQLPQTLSAAKHLIVTLSLPDPESADVVSVSKVEMEDVRLDETIPLSWLPLPKVTAAHQYDGAGVLVGTNLDFTDSYLGKTWRAVVTNEASAEVRRVEGTHALSSVYDAQSWPYLPKGSYKATYYLIEEGREPVKTGSRTFSVGSPTVKAGIVGGYTSYTKYREGDVTAANQCDAKTLYALKAEVVLPTTILNNTNYASLSYGFSATVDGNPISVQRVSKNTCVFDNATGLIAQVGAHPVVVTVIFDGASASTTSNDFFITGLPADFTPPSESAGWSRSGTGDWNGNYDGKPCVRLGQNATDSNQQLTYNSFAIPANTKIEAGYDVMMHGATRSTTLSLTLGSKTYFSETSSSGAFNSKDHNFNSSAVFTTTEAATDVLVNNSYGAGQTCSRIYSLTYKYSE